jgi:hypothetical protein
MREGRLVSRNIGRGQPAARRNGAHTAIALPHGFFADTVAMPTGAYVSTNRIGIEQFQPEACDLLRSFV